MCIFAFFVFIKLRPSVQEETKFIKDASCFGVLEYLKEMYVLSSMLRTTVDMEYEYYLAEIYHQKLGGMFVASLFFLVIFSQSACFYLYIFSPIEERTAEQRIEFKKTGKIILNKKLQVKWVWWEKLFPDIYEENAELAYHSKKELMSLWGMNGDVILDKKQNEFFRDILPGLEYEEF